MPLSAGRLVLPIVIEQRTPGVDTIGQPLTTWTEVCRTRAEPRAPTGLSIAERVIGGQEAAPVVYSLRIRWRVGITEGMRARAGSTIYDIGQVVPDLQNREHVDLVVHTGVSQG